MRDAPVLVKVANPSSQDRTPHGAILFAVLPAAAPYRASGFVHWREAVVRRYSYPALVDVAWCARIEPSSAAAWEIGLPMRF